MWIHRDWPYFEGQRAVQVAWNGWDDVTLGHSVVTGVREALAAAAAAAAAALDLVDLSSTGPHRYGAATLWGYKQQVKRFEKWYWSIWAWVSYTICSIWCVGFVHNKWTE